MREVVNWVDRHDKERRLSYVEFLSDEWYEAANRALQDIYTGDADLSVAYVSENSSHCIVLANGSASVRPHEGAADITLRIATDTAEAIRKGSLSALTAIQEGYIHLSGDIGHLIQSQSVLAAVDRVLITVA